MKGGSGTIQVPAGLRMKKAGKPCRRRIMGAIERPVAEWRGRPLDVLSISRWEVEERSVEIGLSGSTLGRHVR
jgi:hypothetical protein